jgi:uncharacterized BrkB/YihY/UPF0761 family membrane protein
MLSLPQSLAPEIVERKEDTLRFMAEQYGSMAFGNAFGQVFGLVVGIVFALLLLSAVNTAALGWLNDYSGVSEVYKIHKWLGTATAVWSLLSAGAAVLFECREGTPDRARLRGALFFGAILVSVAGFLGGAITFGLDHYNW